MNQKIEVSIKNNKLKEKLFLVLALFCLVFLAVTFSALIIDLGHSGFSRIDKSFLSSFPSRFAHKAGILSAWVGSLYVMFVTSFVAIPLGIGAGIYLEEYAAKNFLTNIIEVAISNLAGVPSIVYGLMALGLFVQKFNLGASILTAGLTLGILILPIVIVATRESIRTIPNSIREAAYAMGATKWQMIWDHTLPYSMGGILTGIIIALSRAIGETAPLVTVGALTFIAFLPTPPISTQAPYFSMQWLQDPFTVLPIQMFNWVSRPQEEFHINAAATGLVLIILTISLNGLALYLRSYFRRKIKW